MDRPYLQDLHIKNYGCIQDASLTLSPLHALIGPNDSGKTTILRAIETLACVVDADAKPSAVLTGLIKSSTRRSDSLLKMAVSAQTELRKSAPKPLYVSETAKGLEDKVVFEFCAPQQMNRMARWRSFWGESIDEIESKGWFDCDWDKASDFKYAYFPEGLFTLKNCTVLRLDPDALRTPRPLLAEGALIRFDDERGLGLPAVYDAIQNRDIQSFLDLNAEIKKLFPDVKSIRLKNPTAGTKSIAITLLDGTDIEAEHMSEGMLYYLAFAALRYIDQPAILLIEEPENGLHPARIVEVMRVLRELSKTTQIILATHSPLVINELEPHEVSVITRSRETGTRATLIKDTANFEERAKVYALGELWLSYANGIDEAPLISGGPRP